MSSYYSLICHIQGVGIPKFNLILKLRLVRSYILYSEIDPKQIQSYEIVCHDRSGDFIHGTISTTDHNRLRIFFCEGDTIAFQYVDVETNKMRFKTTSNNFKFSTCFKTIAVYFNDIDFPQIRFCFMYVPQIFLGPNVKRGRLIGNLYNLLFFLVGHILRDSYNKYNHFVFESY